ncbi:uncharacterized protein LOC113867980 isoform X2 [Abrus precatorius]|uniref:Uncharacterized protein LOC113867980 isoform X2 n=1 Tax=Abrus precatorius TaxID=3816 RepID=A0A8B8LU60_ABRPR|nr:uncharacterized protein LOC113867980 isoform X2 [Abrus precatorius]
MFLLIVCFLFGSQANFFLSLSMKLYDEFKEILKIQKFRRLVSYTGFYCFATLISYAYVNNTTRAGYSRADQFYASYPAGTELLTDTTKLYKAALGNCFDVEEWGPFEYCIMAKHFERQGKSPYAYHAVSSMLPIFDYFVFVYPYVEILQIFSLSTLVNPYEHFCEFYFNIMLKNLLSVPVTFP